LDRKGVFNHSVDRWSVRVKVIHVWLVAFNDVFVSACGEGILERVEDDCMDAGGRAKQEPEPITVN
jgi:hypothetical protein